MTTNGEDSESTPLIQVNASKHEEIYNRFSPAQKRVILSIVSVTGLLPLFVSGTFIPSIPQIAKDLGTTGPVVSLAVSLSIAASSLGGLCGSSYSTFYGRRPVYLVGTPLLFIGSIGVATSQTVPQLMTWRFIQALGASPGIAVGSGTIGDIYKMEERGEAMGIFFAAVLLGPAIAPFIGGFAAHYFSWRLLQLSLAAFGLFAFLVVYFSFPETYHPGQRGVDKTDPATLSTWRPIMINPFKPMWMMRSPNLLFVTTAGLACLLTDYVLLVPLAYTIGVKYGITNEALIGACFLPCGVGNMIGAPLAGRISDKIVIHYRKKRGGEWYPEDRLWATLPGALFLIPVSVLGSGLITEYVPGKLGLILNLICLFMNGVGVDFVLSPCGAYVVDLMHSRSAEAMAANNGFRAIIMSAFVAGILPMIEKYGVLATDISSAIFAWTVGFGLLWVTIRYGERLRAVVDVGFSTAENN